MPPESSVELNNRTKYVRHLAGLRRLRVIGERTNVLDDIRQFFFLTRPFQAYIRIYIGPCLD